MNHSKNQKRFYRFFLKKPLVRPLEYWYQSQRSTKMNGEHDNKVFERTLNMNLEEFIIEIMTGMYAIDGLLNLINYLCHNKMKCLFFHTKIIYLAEKIAEYSKLKES